MPIVDPLHEAFTRAYESALKFPYAAAYEPGWFRTATLKRILVDKLPRQIETFTLDYDLATRTPRIVLTDESNGLRMPIRRANGLNRSFTRPRPAAEPGLFPKAELKVERPNTMDLAALAWDFPEFNEDHEPIGPWSLGFFMAEDGYTLNDGRWKFGLPLAVGATLAEHVEDFNPADEPLILLEEEDEDGAEGSAG